MRRTDGSYVRRWGCYSPKRFKHERSAKGACHPIACHPCACSPRGHTLEPVAGKKCGVTAFARSQHPGEAAGMASTYEGPYAFAFGTCCLRPPSNSLMRRLVLVSYLSRTCLVLLLVSCLSHTCVVYARVSSSCHACRLPHARLITIPGCVVRKCLTSLRRPCG